MKIITFIVLCLLIYGAVSNYLAGEAIFAVDPMGLRQQEYILAYEKFLWFAGFAILDGLLFLFLLFFD